MTAPVSVVTLGGTMKRARLHTRTVCCTSDGVRGARASNGDGAFFGGRQGTAGAVS